MKPKSFNFFKVITQGQTYLNLFYLLLSFPLGVFYFVFLVTGLSLGVGLIITLLGIPILFGTLLLGRVFANFEQQQTKIILGINITHATTEQVRGIWKKLQAYLNDSFTWKSLVYLFIKFPLGIISFVLLVTFLSVALSLIATPIIYHLIETGAIQGILCDGPSFVCSLMDSYFDVIIVGIIGIFLLFVFLHALNGLAYISGLLTKAMLEKKK